MTLRIRNLRPTHFRRMLAVVACSLCLTLSILYAADTAQYPENFRRWVHVGTGVIMADSPIPESEQGMHHVFANQKAVEGYAHGDFADGSVIVYELRRAEQKNGVIVEGKRRRVDVMIKDSNHYASTGGWRFERFYGDDQTQDALHGSGVTCFGCHSKAKEHGSVFSELR